MEKTYTLSGNKNPWGNSRLVQLYTHGRKFVTKKNSIPDRGAIPDKGQFFDLKSHLGFVY